MLENTKISELDFTKNTYKQMNDVAQTHQQESTYLNQIEDIIRHDIQKVKDNVSKIKISEYTGGEAGKAIGVCPVCGGRIIESHTKYGKTLWLCENNDKDKADSCKFALYDKQKYFSDTLLLNSVKVKKLLEGGTVSFKLTAKSGMKYAWDVKLTTNDAGYAQFEKVGFTNTKPTTIQKGNKKVNGKK